MFSNYSLSTDHLNKLLNAARLVLVIYIAYLAAEVSIALLFPKASAPVAAQVTAAPVKPVINIAQLREWNLFGVASALTSTTESAPATDLQLQLTGVFRAKEPQNSSAVIATAGGEANLYHVGDTLPGDAVLDQVYEDRVMLKRNGRLEALAFEKSETSLLESADQTNVATDNNASTLSQLLAEPHKENPVEPKVLLQAFRENIQKDPAATFAATGLRAIPVQKGGGYLVSAGAPDALINSTGLQRGDVVRKINGHLLGDVLADRALFKQLTAQASVQVELERDSRQFTMTVNVPK